MYIFLICLPYYKITTKYITVEWFFNFSFSALNNNVSSLIFEN